MKKNRLITELLDGIGSKGSEKSPKRDPRQGPKQGTENSSEQDTEAYGAASFEDTQAERDDSNASGETETTDSPAGDVETTYAAYLLGNAMLDRIGIPDGISPVEAVREMLRQWQNEESLIAEDAPEPNSKAENYASKTAKPNSRLPRPIRGSMGEVPAADYDSMSREQFMRLKKQLQRATMDGRRVRI